MLLVGGENIIDLIAQSGPSDQIIFQAYEGGSPYNTALAAGLMKANVAYLTPLSTDHLGACLYEKLKKAEVKHWGPRVPQQTALALVTLVNGQASYQFYRQSSADRQISVENLSIQLTKGSALHLGSLALTGDQDGEAWTKLYEMAKDQFGLFTSVDLNIRAHFIENPVSYLDRLERIMITSDLIKLSDEDLLWLSKHLLKQDLTQQSAEEIQESCLSLLDRYQPALFLLTLGSQGSCLWVKNSTKQSYTQLKVPAYSSTQIQDTVGAGDTFMGSFLALIQPHLDDQSSSQDPSVEQAYIDKLEEILAYASCAATMNCERSGCQPPELIAVKDRLILNN